MALSLNGVFGGTKTKQENNSKTKDVTIAGVTNDGTVVVSTNINWKKEGKNDAWINSANISAFPACFNSAFTRITKSQQLDKDLAGSKQTKLKSEINLLEADLKSTETKLDTEKENLDNLNSKIKDKQDEIAEIKANGIKKNRTIVANFIIGGIILVSMTLFLLLFYSSTMYSAFFKDFGEGDTAYTAMFDGAAVSKSFSEGIFEGLFILFFPMTFMGLGFVIHQFSVNKKGFERYFKSFVLYALTFAFDFLLAYKISKAIYDVELPYNPGLPPFSLKVALADMDFWIVIFCGFVTYVIWGLVFSFVMENYDKMTNIKSIVDNLRNQVTNLKTIAAKTQAEINNLTNKILTINADIKTKNQLLTQPFYYNFTAIKANLNDYHFGWVNALTGSYDEKIAPLKVAYDKEMQEVDNWMANHKDKAY